MKIKPKKTKGHKFGDKTLNGYLGAKATVRASGKKATRKKGRFV